MSEKLERLAKLRGSLELYGEDCLRVLDKRGKLVPFRMNASQRFLHAALEKQRAEKGYVRALILKGRRQGCSTYVAARFYQRVTMNKGRSAYILSHEQASSDALFDIVSRFQTNNPIAPHIGTSNIKELVFDKLDSGYAVATAGQKAGGRGRAIMLFHGSEASRWPNARDHFSSSIQAVPLVVGTEILLETTSAGPSGEFYKKYQEAEAGHGDYIAVFLGWHIEEDNVREPGPDFELSKEEVDNYMSEVEMAEMFGLSNAQMAFRRSKIQELGSLELFMQEYPTTAAEAWTDATGIESLIPPILIQRARKAKRDESGPLIFGVDPAGGGGDRFAVAARRGICVPWVQHRNKIDTLEGTAWVRSLIDEHNPARVNIDAGSIGAAIITNLKSLGPKYFEVVRAVNFGGTSQAKIAKPKAPGPRLRRDEMWVRMKEWLELEEGVSIPDDDALASDMAGPRLKPQLTNDTKLEGKAEMKTRGVRSPDLGDAVALTFASNEHFKQYQDATLRPVFADVDTPSKISLYGESFGDDAGGQGWMQ